MKYDVIVLKYKGDKADAFTIYYHTERLVDCVLFADLGPFRKGQHITVNLDTLEAWLVTQLERVG